MIFAADATTEQVISWFSQLGSAGLAALAVWWLTGKHEKAIGVLTAGHGEAFKRVSESLDRQTELLEKRLESYQEMDRQKIASMSMMTATMNELVRRVDALENNGGVKKP